MPEAATGGIYETLAQVLSFEFCEISKNTFFTEHLRRTASKIPRPFFYLLLGLVRV